MKNLSTFLAISLSVLSFTVFAQNNMNTYVTANYIDNAKGSLPNNSVHQRHNVESGIAKYDSIYYWGYDTVAPYWIAPGYEKEINFVYDGNNNNTSYTYQDWTGSAWTNATRYSYTYDVNNNKTSKLDVDWNGSAWVNYTLDSYTYNASNKILSDTSYNWNGSAWVFNNLYIYTYDANNNNITYKYQFWSGSFWINSDLNTYTYDVNNNQISNLYQTWNGSAWTNSTLDTYTYNVNNKQTSDTNKTWSGAWINSYLNIYTYDANNNRITYLVQNWTNPSWTNSHFDTYTYDANNNNTVLLTQSWTGSSWRNTSLTNNTYDVNNLLLSTSEKDYNNAATKFVGGDSIYYYDIGTITGINNLSAQNSDITIYPNPTKGNFTIVTPTASIKTIEIYNLLGENVQIQDATTNASILQVNLNNQPNGIYFYKAIASNGELIGKGKLIIQK